MCVRVLRMNDVNLALFQFDYDLTWMAFLMNAQDQIYSRYGGRDAASDEGRMSTAGLKSTLRRALARHRDSSPSLIEHRKSLLPRELFAVNQKSCLHCHQIWEGIRDRQQKAGVFDSDFLDVYPLPENIGLVLNFDAGTRVDEVVIGTPAASAGLRDGDELVRVGGVEVLSQADVTWALHKAPKVGTLTIEFCRSRQSYSVMLDLPVGWRKTDTSWRKSVR